ncbi:MAG: indole-3-glycerol phosphate synthase TrpC [Alphaproteobacteria bacterium]|nr:indole-3-glycerol phosphate synthase TrpC [Alphaproteobacteria bacterium]
MSDVLARICADKREHVARQKAARPLATVEAEARNQSPTRGFARRLETAAAASGYGLICEIKKASPSKGLIRADFDPPELARAYRQGGATCLSVLTDTPYFQGEDGHLVAARGAVDLPAIRKDFMVDTYQVAEARALGADCILVIMAAVDDALAADLVAAATAWGMDALIEVHDGAELDRALRLSAKIVGINNRNLKTLTVDLAVTEELGPHVPKDRLLIGESGIGSRGDIDRLVRAGARAFLIGESLMRQADVAAATRALVREPARARAAG